MSGNYYQDPGSAGMKDSLLANANNQPILCSLTVDQLMKNYPSLRPHELCPICEIKIGFHLQVASTGTNNTAAVKDTAAVNNQNYVQSNGGYQASVVNVQICSYCKTLAVQKCYNCSRLLCLQHAASVEKGNAKSGYYNRVYCAVGSCSEERQRDDQVRQAVCCIFLVVVVVVVISVLAARGSL